MDELANDLGIEFKKSKDVGFNAPTHSIEFLGVNISTTPVITAQPTPLKITKLTTQIHSILTQQFFTLPTLETLIGKLAFLGQFHSILKLALVPIYAIFHKLLHTSNRFSQKKYTLGTLQKHLTLILAIFQQNLPGAFKK